MKLVAPTDIRGEFCRDEARGLQCGRIVACSSGALWCNSHKRFVMTPADGGDAPKKCSPCVDALDELGDR